MNRTIHEVQFLRFIASSMVLFAHIQHEALTKQFLDLNGFRPIELIYWAGGVDIFFVISGFIMYYLSHDKFGEPGAARTFIVRRFIRVAPPYYAFTLAMLAAMVLFANHVTHSSPTLQQILGSFLFFPLPDPYGQFYPVLILGWTLNYEMLFYTIFTLGLLFSRTWGILIIVGALLALGGTRYVFDPDMPPWAFWAHPIVLEFLFGIGLAYLRIAGFRLNRIAAWSIFFLGVGLLLGVRAIGWPETAGLTRPLLVGLPAFLICMPALVRETGKSPSAVARLMKLGGDISFALYLSHPFSINLIAMLFPRFGLTAPWQYVAISLAFAIIAAIAVYFLFEKPLTDYLNRLLTRRSVKSPSIA